MDDGENEIMEVTIYFETTKESKITPRHSNPWFI